MTTLTTASRELFRRPPDERFETLDDLSSHCWEVRKRSIDRRKSSADFHPLVENDEVCLKIDELPPYRMTEWAFSQTCALAGASKSTVNRLQPHTAAQVLRETLYPRVKEQLDLQALVYDGRMIRSINGTSYGRLWNFDVVDMLMEFTPHFTPPQPGANGGTGLYAGEQDMFCFLIDPTGWVEVGEKAFAPGLFVWNSEVGRRTLGVSTFWFQAVCANHIVWDVTDVKHFARRHTAGVYDALSDIRTIIQRLATAKHERRDQFAKVIARSMKSRFGPDAEAVIERLMKSGFSKGLSARATELAYQSGGFSIWSVVEAITHLNRETQFAGTRSEGDRKASELLALATAAT